MTPLNTIKWETGLSSSKITIEAQQNGSSSNRWKSEASTFFNIQCLCSTDA